MQTKTFQQRRSNRSEDSTGQIDRRRESTNLKVRISSSHVIHFKKRRLEAMVHGYEKDQRDDGHRQ
jgi:hypothetical protein